MTDLVRTAAGDHLVVYVDGRPFVLPPDAKPQLCGLCGRLDAYQTWAPPLRWWHVLRPVLVCSEVCKDRLKAIVRLDDAAGEWVAEFCKRQGLDWEQLSKGERFLITREVPCNIRCWRIGGAVTVAPGEKCPECGKERPVRTRYERMLEGESTVDQTLVPSSD